MGMAAAYKTRRILANGQLVLATELLCGAQGLELLKPLRPGKGVQALFDRIRAGGLLPLGEDRPPTPDMERLRGLVAAGELAPPG
jgi:histidine ammonia-lyase